MHLSAIALCLATAVQLAWSYPQYLFLRSKSSTPAFNNLYLSGYEPPSFIKLNADALTYNLLPAPTTPNGPNLYYLGFNYTSYQAGMRAVLDFDNQEYAYFEPVSFVKAGVGNTAFQNRFFINGTGSNSQLVWKNDPKSDYQVGNWLSELLP